MVFFKTIKKKRIQNQKMLVQLCLWSRWIVFLCFFSAARILLGPRHFQYMYMKCAAYRYYPDMMCYLRWRCITILGDQPRRALISPWYVLQGKTKISNFWDVTHGFEPRMINSEGYCKFTLTSRFPLPKFFVVLMVPKKTSKNNRIGPGPGLCPKDP